MSNDFGLAAEEWHALEELLRCRRAWTNGLSEPMTSRLVEMGFVVLWTQDAQGRALKGGPYATLTPWGAEKLGVELRERRWVQWIHDQDHYERVLIEEPYWAPITSRFHHALVLPRQSQQCGLQYPELIPDPVAGPEYLTDEEGEALMFFGGYKATIDRRLSHH